ncbi:MAG: Gfo/Idh/MocA family oxidoreductase, partial [Caldiserica bacterium]|nr:Gfo/Idh/MocA family oxidoreductase [Caldisericota bacterium]
MSVRIGVIGAGRIGRLHAENIVRYVRDAEVVAVADIVEEAARRCAGDLGIPRAFADYRAVLEDGEVDAVLICTSTDTH